MPVVRLIPNLLTVLRMGLALFFPFSPQHLWFVLVSAALATEFLDGFLARRLKACSEFGRLSDPVADKLFVGAVVLSLFWVGRMTWYEMLLVGARDLTVFLAVIVLYVRKQRRSIRALQPRASGKLTTALQFGLLLGLVAWPLKVTPLLWFTIALSLWSGFDYLRSWKVESLKFV